MTLPLALESVAPTARDAAITSLSKFLGDRLSTAVSVREQHGHDASYQYWKAGLRESGRSRQCWYSPMELNELKKNTGSSWSRRVSISVHYTHDIVDKPFRSKPI